ncbi:globin [Teladorsagia circumcincta]|uniref:Globin n=1 Tax=Teladorsagia circumcincta TaxID=45464 RepID=A0A2G9UQA3_TELCI|nr:globin [Teladorsagia circumcincta]
MADVKKHCMESLGTVPLGRAPEQVQNGKDFYKYLFTNHPDLRKYFKGAENFTADDVQKSDRFEKLGTGLLLSVHLLANTYDNEMVFRAFCRETIDRHVGRDLDPSLWKGFWGIFVAFLESRGTALTADQKAAWEKLGSMFNEECQLQLAKHGLPHL